MKISAFVGEVMRVWRLVARLGVVLICSVGSGMVAVAPAQAAPGLTAQLAALPDRFTAGAGASTVSAVISSSRGDCLKVRWSLVLRVRAVRLDQVRVDRIEEDGSFPVDVRTEDGAARITDVRPDPGTLCRDRTVTARYQIAFAADAPDGRITLTAEAFDAELRPLAEASATRPVDGRRERAAPPARPATTPARPEPTESAAVVEDEPVVPPEDLGVVATTPSDPVGEAAGAGGGTGRTDRASAGNGLGAAQAGFLLGGLLLFLGVGLLLRLRSLLRRPAPSAGPAVDDRWRPASARTRSRGRRRRFPAR